MEKIIKSEAEWRAELDPVQYHVLREAGTERAFAGKLTDEKRDGEFRCAGCGTTLFASDTKFDSGCGWPSFDQEIRGAVTKIPDADGRRTEIICSNCNGHLGHVFYGEGFTDKDTRHCVNTTSLKFVAKNDLPKIEKAILTLDKSIPIEIEPEEDTSEWDEMRRLQKLKKEKKTKILKKF